MGKAVFRVALPSAPHRGGLQRIHGSLAVEHTGHRKVGAMSEPVERG